MAAADKLRHTSDWDDALSGVSIVDVRSGFVDRTDAGEVLADAVADALDPGVSGVDVVVLGLPRGGVPVAAVVARRLGAILDLLAVRKVGTPGHVELAIGAIASGQLVFINESLVAQLGLRQRDVEGRLEVARRELEDQERRLRGDRPRSASSSPCRSVRPTPAPSWRRSPTTSSAPSSHRPSPPSASGTATSRRRPTRTYCESSLRSDLTRHWRDVA
jgi:hypothetical protein